MKTVYVCEDSVAGIFSAIYDAWKTKRREEQLGIVLQGFMYQELFCEYVEVETSVKKSVAVEQLIKKHLSYDAYWHIYHALLSDDEKKADAVLGTMLEARQIADSTKIMQHLTHDKVQKVFELSRKVSNEAHYFLELIRFAELENGVLFSKIAPKSQILSCIGDHFANRFPLENFMIYDETHRQFLVHQKEKQWVLVWDEELDLEAVSRVSYAEGVFSELWKDFFKSISIKERENPKLQKQHLPIRFRSNIVEFQ